MLTLPLRLVLVTLLLAIPGCSEPRAAAPGGQGAPAEAVEAGFLDRETLPMILRATSRFTGDLDEIRERKVLRVLVSHSRTNFFLAAGQVRGFEYEMFNELEKHLAKQRKEGEPPLKIAFLPVPFEELIPALLAGRGDVAAAALTITPERSAKVAFSEPYLEDVDQILVAHRDAPLVTRWEDLAGKIVIAVAGTSYVEHLQGINRELQAKQLPPMEIHTGCHGLTTEDMLELVSSGAFPYTVADRYLAELWAEVLEGLHLVPELTADRGGRIAWAVRPGNPKLKAGLDAYAAENRQGTLIGNVLFKRYYGKTNWLRNPLLEVSGSRIEPFLPPLKRFSEQYGFDWRLIAAQAYQESRLDPEAVSRSGAVGLMQLLPSTAKDMGFTDLKNPEDNLHAGVKYMDWLRKNFFDEPGLSPEAQTDFTLAAYNAGPSRVKRWRAAAPERGLDPNEWFGSVELLALEDVGMQPVQYVGNINKYFLIFTLLIDDVLARGGAREALEGEGR